MDSPILWVVGLFIAFLALRHVIRIIQAKKYEQERLRLLTERHAILMAKYADEATVEAIMRSQIWQGMSAEQLIDSRGQADDVAEKIYKAKTVHTYKYDQTGRGRFATKIIVENGYVVGWETK